MRENGVAGPCLVDAEDSPDFGIGFRVHLRVVCSVDFVQCFRVNVEDGAAVARAAQLVFVVVGNGFGEALAVVVEFGDCEVQRGWWFGACWWGFMECFRIVFVLEIVPCEADFSRRWCSWWCVMVVGVRHAVLSVLMLTRKWQGLKFVCQDRNAILRDYAV